MLRGAGMLVDGATGRSARPTWTSSNLDLSQPGAQAISKPRKSKRTTNRNRALTASRNLLCGERARLKRVSALLRFAMFRPSMVYPLRKASSTGSLKASPIELRKRYTSSKTYRVFELQHCRDPSVRSTMRAAEASRDQGRRQEPTEMLAKQDCRITGLPLHRNANWKLPPKASRRNRWLDLSI
jgi:hypothetical protein